MLFNKRVDSRRSVRDKKRRIYQTHKHTCQPTHSSYLQVHSTSHQTTLSCTNSPVKRNRVGYTVVRTNVTLTVQSTNQLEDFINGQKSNYRFSSTTLRLWIGMTLGDEMSRNFSLHYEAIALIQIDNQVIQFLAIASAMSQRKLKSFRHQLRCTMCMVDCMKSVQTARPETPNPHPPRPASVHNV